MEYINAFAKTEIRQTRSALFLQEVRHSPFRQKLGCRGESLRRPKVVGVAVVKRSAVQENTTFLSRNNGAMHRLPAVMR